MYLRLPLFLIFSLDLTAYSLVPSDRVGILLMEPLPWRAAPLGTFGGDPSPASILGALPFTLRLWLPQGGLCCPSGHPDGKFSAATQPARSEGGRLRWRLQTRLAAAIPSALFFFFFFSSPRALLSAWLASSSWQKTALYCFIQFQLLGINSE